MLRALLLAAAASAALAVLPATAPAKTVWLCHPAQKDVCDGSLTAQRFSPSGVKGGVVRATADQQIDCFYVYPTVSQQATLIATKRIDPELRSIALYQAARYAQHCRIFAPVYRQRTIAGIAPGASSGGIVNAKGYADVRAAWREYLRRDNRGRGVVLIGHSQGTFVLRKLLTEEVDRSAKERGLLVSAVLLGGNVLVKTGSDRGGDLQNIPACRENTQTGCVIAFSTYDEPPPADALFARTAEPDREILCTNPANLAGGEGTLTTILPSAPFAPGTSIAAGIGLLGFPALKTTRRWIQVDGAYRAACVREGDAVSLRVTAQDGAPDLRASPVPAWGLHLVDANLPLGDLVSLVGAQSRAWRAARS